jgi:hypothetical protein
MTTILNIANIINQGEPYERAFFVWLELEKIPWYVSGSDLYYIGLFEEQDELIIKEFWQELKIIE